MKILINKISNKDLNDFGTDGYLLGSNSNFYSYQVEFGTNPGGKDEVAISDGCNRYIPVAIENVPALMAALHECWALHREIVAVDSLIESIESDEEAYVDYNEVEYND